MYPVVATAIGYGINTSNVGENGCLPTIKLYYLTIHHSEEDSGPGMQSDWAHLVQSLKNVQPMRPAGETPVNSCGGCGRQQR